MKDSRWCRVGFGQRVRALRMERNWTQATAAQRCEIDSKSFGAIERGERNISLHIIARIGRGFSVELHELFLFSPKQLSTRSGLAKKQIFKAIRVAPPQQSLLMLGILNEVINWKRASDSISGGSRTSRRNRANDSISGGVRTSRRFASLAPAARLQSTRSRASSASSRASGASPRASGGSSRALHGRGARNGVRGKNRK